MVNRELNILRRIFELARKAWGFAAPDPVAGIARPKPPGRARRLGPTEEQFLLCGARSLSGPYMQHLIAFAIATPRAVAGPPPWTGGISTGRGAHQHPGGEQENHKIPARFPRTRPSAVTSSTRLAAKHPAPLFARLRMASERPGTGGPSRELWGYTRSNAGKTGRRRTRIPPRPAFPRPSARRPEQTAGAWAVAARVPVHNRAHHGLNGAALCPYIRGYDGRQTGCAGCRRDKTGDRGAPGLVTTNCDVLPVGWIFSEKQLHARPALITKPPAH